MEWRKPMGFLDLFTHNKIKEPQVVKDVDMSELEKLNSLLGKVGDDQKDIVENQMKASMIGLDGEKRVMYELKHLSKPCLILHDVTLFDKSAEQSQMDFIVLTRNCGFILESKCLSGDIKIDSEGNFTRILKTKDGKVYKTVGIYSPIHQNEIHLSVLNTFFNDNKLPRNYPIEPIVVISNDRCIVNKTFAPSSIKNSIVKYDQLNVKILQLMNKHADIDVSDDRLLNIAEALKENDTPRPVDYVASLHLKLADKEVVEETSKAQESGFIDDKNTSEKLNDDKLLKELKQYRVQKAEKWKTQPYRIFDNQILEGIITSLPTNKAELLEIEGFTEKKYQYFGEDILKIVNGDSYVPQKETTPVSVSDSDAKLIGALKKYRFKKAEELHLPAYCVFNNAQMNQLVSQKPKTKEELLKLTGFTEKKTATYGDDILKIILGTK